MGISLSEQLFSLIFHSEFFQISKQAKTKYIYQTFPMPRHYSRILEGNLTTTKKVIKEIIVEYVQRQDGESEGVRKNHFFVSRCQIINQCYKLK